jgi:hypothetical protein
VGSVWSGPSGCCINWTTSAIIPPTHPGGSGHGLRGRTFIIPIITSNYDNGSLSSGFLTGARTSASTLVSAAGANLRVWHRPKGGTGGIASAFTGSSVNDKAAVLRSRRD